MEATIASSTIVVEEIERSSSHTPCEYFDCVNEKADLLPNSIARQAQLSTPPTQTTLALENSLVDNLEITTVSSTKDTEQASVSHLITTPSTPPNRTTSSFHTSFDKIGRSPSSSSQRSTFSSSPGADEEPESPNTQRSNSSSPEPLIASEFLKSEPTKPSPEKQLPCLQCKLANLSCSFTVPPQRRRTRLQKMPKLCCTRCGRDGRLFCILQIEVGKKVVKLGRTRLRGSKPGEETCEYTYFAEGVESEVVLEGAEEMLEAERAKMRFALPAWTVARKNLKPIFGGWPKADELLEGTEV